MFKAKAPLEDEQKSIRILIQIYCTGVHKSDSLCQSCQELERYAVERLARCPYQEKKGPCKTCPTHCYKPSMQNAIRQAMRYAGPRLLLKHPIYAFKHFWLTFNKFFKG